jgi:hypothetical protein
MIDNTIYTEDFKLWVFDFENPEWERVRNLCLEEKNWLRENYLPHRCKITDHKVFFISYYLDGRPMMFGGIKEYTENVARVFNRMYAFPYVRSPKKFSWHHKIMIETIMPAMIESIEKKYKLIFTSMQMRNRKYQGEQKWWTYWKNSWFEYAPDWKEFNGLVQTYPAEEASCYQNIVYKDSLDFTFKDWNPKILTYQQFYDRFNYFRL